MGAYARCWLDDWVVTGTKDFVDPRILGLFHACDRQVFAYADPMVPSFIAQGNEQDPDFEFNYIYYTTSVAEVRDRLDLYGYTVENCKRLFDEWVALEVEQRESWSVAPPSYCELGNPQSAQFASEYRVQLGETLKRLRQLTAGEWIHGVAFIREHALTSADASKHQDSYIGYMLSGMGGEWHGYEATDPLIAIRLTMEAFPDAQLLTYDLTDLIVGESLRPDEDPHERLGAPSAASRVVILTEGKSDAAFLKEALELLFPHLASHYSFMDFSDHGGGAGQLANLVRSFTGAGIVNRVVAIFDNDAAGIAAMRTLRKTAVPAHIVVMRLPDFLALQEYPTLGPNGSAPMNINGMAASLELYLGSDALRGEARSFPPIQWTGYERSINTYQGELLAKQEVQERFREKLASARTDPKFLNEADWSGLRLIFSQLFKAFHSLDCEQMSREQRDLYNEINS